MRTSLPAPKLSRGDLETDALGAEAELALDIETSGLDWVGGRIACCQVATRDGRVFIVRTDDRVPPRLCHLLGDPRVRKVFHHAMFDLRFLCRAWAVRPRNVACTKVASKLLRPEGKEHSLRALVREFLGVEIDKSVRMSDWFADPWTPEQVRYAAADAAHLLALHDALAGALAERHRADLAARCYEHIPTRVEIEVGGFGDVFTY